MTISNLFLGVLSIVFAGRGELLWSAGFIFLATIPDFLDGLLARLLKATSSIGKDLDSLADMVSFAVAPSILFFELGRYAGYKWLPYVALIIPLFGAIRLAKFNNDDRQEEVFYGLPTPSAALFLAAWPFLFEESPNWLQHFVSHPAVLITVPVLLSILMVSELQLFSLKFKTFGIRENSYRYALLAGAVVLIVLLQFAAIPAIILLYIILSLTRNLL